MVPQYPRHPGFHGTLDALVSQCLTEGRTRGLALVPKLALDVMACEVLRVLQLTDAFVVPVSYAVPRKRRAPLQLSKPGRLPDTAVPTIQNGTAVADLSWDPFDARRLAVAGEDAKIRLWRIPEGGLRDTLQEPEAVLRGHTEKIYSVRFHPVAADILVSSSYDMTVRIWELGAGQEVLCLRGHTDQIFSLAWSPDGKKLATVSKDGKLRLYDPRRSPEPEQEAPARKFVPAAVYLAEKSDEQKKEELLSAMVAKLGNRDDPLPQDSFEGVDEDEANAGLWAAPCQPPRSPLRPHSRSERRILLYQARDLPAGPLAVLGIDVAPSTLLPFYDEDTGVVFLTGKGDTRVFLYEVTPEPPHFLECNSFTSSDPHKVRGAGRSLLWPGGRARGSRDGRVSPQAKYLAQIILVGAQVVGRAFARALRQEFAASRAAADARGRSERPQSAAASRITGISLQEAQQILNVSNLNAEEIQKNYDHLFKVNDKSVGGSFYLQSKVVRAKERLDEEIRIQAQSEKEKGWKAET
nr:PREDICTED: coronin-7-like [Apteryx mantelli mantelli]